MEKWLTANKLVINVGKTKSMVISNILKSHDVPAFFIKNKQIEMIDKIKFLGVLVDSRLDFKEHVKQESLKMARAVGIIRRISFCVPDQVLIT